MKLSDVIIKPILSEKINKQTEKALLKRSCYAEVYEALGKPSAVLFNDVFDKALTEVSKNTN